MNHIAAIVRFSLLLLAWSSQLAVAEPVRYTGDGEMVDFSIEQTEGKALLFVADKSSNEPLAGISPVLVPDDEALVPVNFAATTQAGVYEATITGKLPEGSLRVDGALAEEVEVYEERVTSHDPHEGHDHSHGAHKPDFSKIPNGLILAVVGALVVGFLLGWISSRGAVQKVAGEAQVHVEPVAKTHTDSSIPVNKQVSGLLLILAASGMLYGKSAVANEGHTHAELSISTRGGDSGIFVSKKSQFLLGMRTNIAEKSQLVRSFQTFGHASPAPMLDAFIKSPATGIFVPAKALLLGSNVQKDEILGWIESVGKIPVRSPLAGSLTAMEITQSTRVDAGDSLFRVSDGKMLWVDAEVFQKDLPKIKAAKSVVVNFDGREPVKGKVMSFKTMLSEQSLTGKVFVEVGNPDAQIAIGSLGTVSFIEEASEEQVFELPRRSVLSRGGEMVVFIQTGPEMFEQRSVVVEPASTPDQIIIRSGIEEGDRVVVSGNYQLLTAAH